MNYYFSLRYRSILYFSKFILNHQYLVTFDMAKAEMTDLLSKLSLDSEKEDHLTFYLTALRRKRVSYLLSKNALFIQEITGNQWIYLQLRKIKNIFVWGCSVCEDMRTFKNIKEHKEVFENYCVHAQVAFMLVNKDEFENKY